MLRQSSLADRLSNRNDELRRSLPMHKIIEVCLNNKEG